MEIPGRKRQRFDDLPGSKTVETLIDMVGRGRISVTGAVDLANSIIGDGMDHKTVSSLASLGSFNQHPGNNERDLFRWLKEISGISLSPYPVTMNLQVPWALIDHLLICYCCGL